MDNHNLGDTRRGWPLVLFLLLSSLLLKAQPYIPSPGEYCSQILNVGTGQLYTIGFTSAQFYPTVAATGVAGTGAGAHGECYIDGSGNVYCRAQANTAGEFGPTGIGGGIANWTRISVDSSGNPFTNIKVSYTMFDQTFWIKSNGTLWVAGNLNNGLRGDGSGAGGGVVSAPNPVQIVFPAGITITQISGAGCGGCAPSVVGALDNNGDVWTWGGNNNFTVTQDLGQSNASANGLYPVKIVFPVPIVQIAMANFMHFALGNNGHIYAWGWYVNYAGDNSVNGGLFGNSPVDITASLGIVGTVKEIGGSWSDCFAITTAGTLWGWGDQVYGGLGNGVIANWAAPLPAEAPNPYAYGFYSNCLMQVSAVQIAPGFSNFAHIYANGAYCPFAYFTDNSNNIYFCGRNKIGVAFNGVIDASPGNEAIDAVYPDSWDIPWITNIPVPGSITAPIYSSSPYCVPNPGGSPCNLYSIPVTAPPNCSAGANQSVAPGSTTLAGTVSGNGGSSIMYGVAFNAVNAGWTQISGPNTAQIVFPSATSTQVNNLIAGTYVFQLRAVDNNWRTTTSTVQVVVGGVAPVVSNAGSPQTITLPTNSVTLNGSLSTGPIVTYTWIQQSGPSVATLGTPNTVTTTASGLIAGTYVFQLTVAPSSGPSSSSTVAITVNPALIANAGSPQTITLPTNAVTLSASGSTGVITSYLWSLISGPNTPTIVTPTASGTQVTGLIAGTYVIGLGLNGQTSGTGHTTVSITVNPAVITGCGNCWFVPVSTIITH